MKLNTDKCHLLVCGNKHECMLCTVGDSQVIETRNVKLLGVVLDSKLSFEDHLNLIIKKASGKLNALSRQCSVISFYKRKMLLNAFFLSQFSHCPLIWMCHSRSVNTRINNLHFRALRMIYKDNSASFQELLSRDGSVTMHHRNLQSLATEMFKVSINASPDFMKEVFPFNTNLLTSNPSAETRQESLFYNPVNPKKVYMGLETLRVLGPKIWNLLPKNIKLAPSLSVFKEKIKSWVPLKCPCRLCKVYITELGFI